MICEDSQPSRAQHILRVSKQGNWIRFLLLEDVSLLTQGAFSISIEKCRDPSAKSEEAQEATRRKLDFIQR